MSSQNHNFAVDPSTLPKGVEVTHINLNDGTCAGTRRRATQGGREGGRSRREGGEEGAGGWVGGRGERSMWEGRNEGVRDPDYKHEWPS